MDAKEVLSFTVILQSAALEILIVDDHPFTCEGYELIINKASKQDRLPSCSLKKVNSLEVANKTLTKKNIKNRYFDIVILDIRFMAFPDNKLYSGEDLGKLIRKLHPETKLLVITSILDKHRLNAIFASLNPEGFLTKTEVTQETLILALRELLNDNPYYSPYLLKIIRNQHFSGLQLSEEQKEFLYLLSTGVSSKEIPNYLPWSASKVEKQKRTLRDKLGAKSSSVFALVHMAKKLGII